MKKIHPTTLKTKLNRSSTTPGPTDIVWESDKTHKRANRPALKQQVNTRLQDKTEL